MSKVIGIVFSDLHINDWAKFNKNDERTKNHFKVLSIIKKACHKYECPAFFCGDMFHKPENMSLHLHSLVVEQFNKPVVEPIYFISGNHCINNVSKINEVPESWLNSFSKQYKWLKSLDFSCHTDEANKVIYHGVPYIDHNIGLNEYLKNRELAKGYKHVLLLHTDYPGAKDTDGMEVGTSENLNINLLDRFDLTIIGHIHKPQRLAKKVYMVGAPLQQRRTDKDCDLGYWKLHNDLTMEFVSLSDRFPKFIDVDSEDKVKDDGNYYTVLSSKVEVDVSKTKITKKLSKKRIVKRYLKEHGINDEEKTNCLLDIIKDSENE